MAGVAGKSGGARKGAGRKPKVPVIVDVSSTEKTKAEDAEVLDPLPESSMFEDPKEFLLAVMKHTRIDIELRVNAAKSLLPFTHKKMGEGRAKSPGDNPKQSAFSFGSLPPPRLVKK